jgi:two-component system, LuxR family, response regulator FixJ
MNTNEATVFVVDDDASVRRSLARLLRAAGWNVEALPTAREFLQRVPISKPGCVVLDVRMPEMTGPELHDRMSEMELSLPVVFLTGHGDVPTSVQAMKRGAVDFLLKPVDAGALLQAVTRAVEWHTAKLAQQRGRQHVTACLVRLTTREREVLDSVIRGDRNKQIAADLGISEKTVKVHRGRVMDKMEARSVAELVHLCEAAGIESDPPGAKRADSSGR